MPTLNRRNEKKEKRSEAKRENRRSIGKGRKTSNCKGQIKRLFKEEGVTAVREGRRREARRISIGRRDDDGKGERMWSLLYWPWPK